MLPLLSWSFGFTRGAVRSYRSGSFMSATIFKPRSARRSFVLVIVLLLVLDWFDYEQDYE